jgi:hypothetical protein
MLEPPKPSVHLPLCQHEVQKLNNFARRITEDCHAINFRETTNAAKTMDALNTLLETALALSLEVMVLQTNIDANQGQKTPISLQVLRGVPYGTKIDST